jgi:hypothetical protein
MIRSSQGRSEPCDRDPVVRVKRYRFGVGVNQSRPIQDLRSGLDSFKYRSGPSDLDRMAIVSAYPFVW